jgi:hypothetical protein
LAVNGEHQDSTRAGDLLDLDSGIASVLWDGDDTPHVIPVQQLQYLRTDVRPFKWTNWSK